MKIRIESLQSAELTVSNAAEQERAMEITATVTVRSGRCGQITAGKVVKDNVQVGSFNSYSEGQINMDLPRSDADGSEVLAAAKGFAQACRERDWNADMEIQPEKL